MSKRTHSFNVLMSPEEYDRLVQVAAAQELPKSEVIRKLITSLHFMLLQGAPTCASGQRCFVPHLHPTDQRAESPAPARAAGPPPVGGGA